MLSKDKQKVLHSLNMATREVLKTNDIHEWYYYYSKVYELLSVAQLKKYYGLKKYSRNRRKPQN